MLDDPDARVHVNAACVSVCVRGGLSVGRYTQTDVERVETRREPAFHRDGSGRRYCTICYVRIA